MVWPIPVLPTTWTNETPQLDTHPDTHNAVADALNELAARWDALPRGWVAQGVGNAVDQTGITTSVDIVGASATWTADPTRRYKTTLRASIAQVTNASTLTLSIVSGAGTFLRRAALQLTPGAMSATITVELIETGLSGSTTRKGQLFSSAASATITNTSGHSSALWVEDIGKV